MRFTNLQALRILGAGIVVLCHLNYHAGHTLNRQLPLLQWIYDYLPCVVITVFFSMSGFVLVHSLERTTARQFIQSRLLRIFPAYWLAVFLVVLFERHPGLVWFTEARSWAGLSLLPMGRDAAAYRLGIEWTLVYEFFFYAMLGLIVTIDRRRGPTIGAGVWLIAIVMAIVLRPAAPYNPLPNWREIALSPFNAPILLGALAVHLQRCERLLKLVAPVAVPTLYIAARLIPRWELAMLLAGVASALLVSWAAATKQLAADHPLAKYGDWSYGVYLLHVPVITAIFEAAIRNHWTYGVDLIAGAGCVALAVGLTYGFCEASVYRRLRRWLVTTRPAVEPAILKLSAGKQRAA